MTNNRSVEILKDFASDSQDRVDNIDVSHVTDLTNEILSDPEFLADIEKSKVLTELRMILTDSGESQSGLARRWGKSRQYVSKLFNDEQLTNFTVETIFHLAHLLGKKIAITIHNPDEIIYKVKSQIEENDYVQVTSSGIVEASYTRGLCSFSDTQSPFSPSAEWGEEVNLIGHRKHSAEVYYGCTPA